ncbi:DUF6368 family protein [Streptomyces wuyuanensis]|uniref:DUF6368 family protein n=1 Tax=Streptomyces wuyuanensis TaxID=1196353 RepID=UPI0036AA7161
MPGPAASLLLFEPLTGTGWDATASWLGTFCRPVEPVAGGGLDLWIEDATPIGAGDVRGGGKPFHMAEESEDVFAEYDFGGFERPPVQEIVVSAYVAGCDSHRLLGHLTASLARRLGALIGCNGLLGHRYDAHGEGPEQEAAAPAAARALVGGIGGVVHEVPYTSGDGVVRYTHVCDGAFMESWLRHPEFRMVR